MLFLSSSLVVALAAYANAAAIPKSIFKSSSLSLTCQNSILALVSSPLSTCLNLNAVIPIVLSPASSPLIPPITSFNTGLCAAPECTESDIESTITELAKSCSSELEALQIDQEQAVALAQKIIPAAKKVLCLQDSTATPTSTFCLTTFLKTVEEALLAPEQLTKENAKKAFSLIREGDPTTTPGLQKVIDLKCSECAKQADKIIQEAFASAPGTAAVKKLETKLKKFKKFSSSTCDGPAPPAPSGTEPPTPSGSDAPAPPKPTSTDAPTPGGDKDGDGWPDAPDEDVPSPSGPEPPTPTTSEPPSTPSESGSAPEPSATGPTTPSPGEPGEPPSDEPPSDEPPSDEPPADDSLTRRSPGTAQYIFKRLLGLLW